MDILQIVIQAGAVGLALVTMGILYKFITNHTDHTNKVIEKNSEAATQLAVSITKHTETIGSLEETIRSKL